MDKELEDAVKAAVSDLMTWDELADRVLALEDESAVLKKEIHRARTDSRYWDEFNTISKHDVIKNENEQLSERMALLVDVVESVADSLFPGPLYAKLKQAIAFAKEAK